jgi:uncharacterized membrane protein HdeD (DUF308 family)
MMLRLFLLSGMVSVLLGILYITSMLVQGSGGLHTWGYLLLLWGMIITVLSLNKMERRTFEIGLSVIGIMLHGSLAFYWILFPEGFEKPSSDGEFILFAFPSILVTIVCAAILGRK